LEDYCPVASIVLPYTCESVRCRIFELDTLQAVFLSNANCRSGPRIRPTVVLAVCSLTCQFSKRYVKVILLSGVPELLASAPNPVARASEFLQTSACVKIGNQGFGHD
jgi:hypothetical protein